MYAEKEQAKQVHKIRIYFNYFTSFIGTNTQGSGEFTCIPNFSFRLFNLIQKSNDCVCITIDPFHKWLYYIS